MQLLGHTERYTKTCALLITPKLKNVKKNITHYQFYTIQLMGHTEVYPKAVFL